MASSRIFVSNLSPQTTEEELCQLFQDYGQVERVELKVKDGGDTAKVHAKSIAFITIKINLDDLNYCIDELGYQKLHGSSLKVSVAKESFLDRLKREREESALEKSFQQTVSQCNESTLAHFTVRNNQNTRRTFADDENFDEFCNIAPELMITKKCAANSIFNGKIFIENDKDVEPLHIIEEKRQMHKQSLGAKTNAADEKRKKSLKNMKNIYKQQKSAIQDALAGLNIERTQKIRFKYAEEEESKYTEKKLKLFTDDGGDEDIVLPDYKAKNGEKLILLQRNQSLDPRFKMSEHFIDDDDNKKEEHNYGNNNEANQESNERDWQFRILEQVTGQKIPTTKEASTRKKSMMHYDPSKEEHNKYLRPLLKDNLTNLKTTTIDVTTKSSKFTKVSSDVFFVVTDTLQESLKCRDDGFSLLNMFDNAELTQREQEIQKVNNGKILVKRSKTNDFDVMNFFSYDSSASENESIQQTKQSEYSKNALATSEIKNNTMVKYKMKAKVEKINQSYFVPKNDPRLKEGARMFKYHGYTKTEENYEKIRNRLKILIKTKITKSKKKVSKSGVKLCKKSRKQFR